jgi:hypothetical protein
LRDGIVYIVLIIRRCIITGDFLQNSASHTGLGN